MIQLRPGEADLSRLKSPLGLLLRGEPAETIPQLRRLIDERKPPMLTAVGDVVSRETLEAGLMVHLRLVDNKTLRRAIVATKFTTLNAYRVTNPAGVIRMDAWETIREAIRGRADAVILVEGEEDLLALPCVVESPDNAFVIYGQPSEGMVVVTASAAIKKETRSFLDQMPREEVLE